MIGAGVGGLTTAAVLARSGLDVTVLEAHVYPGGCAGTFFHKGYRFDAGATLAGGFYPGGPMDIVAGAAGVSRWPAMPSDTAMAVHLPGGASMALYGDERRWQARNDLFGPKATPFWQWQEQTADSLWSFALRTPPWPPQTPGEAVQLAGHVFAWATRDVGPYSLARRGMSLMADLARPVSAHLRGMPERLRLFVDAQLLISAQATSASANALYGASALDLPRRGVVHLRGGMGAIAETLAGALRSNGGKISYRQEVSRIVVERGRPFAVETKRGDSFEAGMVIANLPPWNLARLLGDNSPPRLRNLPERPNRGGGAFMVYAGVDASVVPDGFPLHHQIVLREPMGEGNTVFLSLSPEWDEGRAPSGRRSLTISTHTQLEPWWQLRRAEDSDGYERRKSAYADRLLSAAESLLPGLGDAADLILPASPVTFQRFTRRDGGWVGGFPQTDLLLNWSPRIAPGVWMVGDSIFPGQSTAAVALGGMRVAHSVLREYGMPLHDGPSHTTDPYPHRLLSESTHR